MKLNQNITKFEVETLAETKQVAASFAKQIQVGNIIIFCGDLGAGKTEFIKTVCFELGVKDSVTSPSFTIINQYQCEFATIFHVDLYRIVKKEELFEIGFYELFDLPNSIFFIEWPENSFNTIPFINYKIQITHTTQHKRALEIIQYV